MKRGGKFLVSTMMLAVAGCGGDMGKLEIRSTPTKLAKGNQPVPHRIAEARGQLALGNVALALEAFRIAARDDPNSTDALLGIAACYDHMGRFDLSRRNYEAALAIAPGDTNLLAAFASSLQLQGRTDEVLSVRQEIAARAAATQQTAAAPAAVAPAPEVLAIAAPVAVAPVAPAQPVQVVAAPEPELPARAWASEPVRVTASAPEKVAFVAPSVDPVTVEMAADEPAAAPAPAPKPAVKTAAAAQSVTIKLPPARPVQAPAVTLSATSVAKPAAAAPAPAQPAAVLAPPDAEMVSAAPFKPRFREAPAPAFAEEHGPRLERVSMGEISLITVPRPVWRAATVARSERSTRVRFVPLREASTVPAKVRVLNAARVNRLAARTRSWLMARGWSKMGIGDSEAARTRSLILYPPGQRVLAQNLANQFGFEMEERSNLKFVTMLLGRDAARIEELRPKHA